MSEDASELTLDYVAALRDHLAAPSETTLQGAYSLGRQAMSEGLGVLHLAAIHQEALAALLARSRSPEESARWASEASAFLFECLAPFEMSLRGFQEANAQLRALNVELERARDAAERESRFKTSFLAGMSHELRTPLNAILGFSDLLGEEAAGPLTPEQKEYVQYVHASGRHLLELVNDILDLARIEAGRMELQREWTSCAVGVDAVFGALRPLADKQGVALHAVVPADLPQLRADVLRLKQILYNLLSNGIKFTPSGGSVRLRARPMAGGIEIAVEDTGIGIRARDLPRLFREFERIEPASGPRREGTGLGLVLVRRLVEMHGGKIAVESTVGKGTTFTVYLPFDAAGEDEAAETDAAEEGSGGSA